MSHPTSTPDRTAPAPAPNMDYVTFMAHLAKTSHEPWEITPYGPIRVTLKGRCYCPITRVCLDLTGKYFSTENATHAAVEIHLGEDQAIDIISAADDLDDEHIRKDLLNMLVC